MKVLGIIVWLGLMQSCGQQGDRFVADEQENVIEGDIILDHHASEFALTDKNSYAPNYGVNPWPLGIVPYVITDSVKDAAAFHGTYLIDRVHQAMKNMQERTQIRFVEYDPLVHTFFIKFINDGNPRSYLGNIKAYNGQPLYLSSSIAVLGVQHELGHALGLFHEETRMDRLDSIILHEDLMDPSCYSRYLFYTYNSWFNLQTPYDFDSMMHANYNLCKKKELGDVFTIEPVDGHVLSKNRTYKMTDYDVWEIDAVHQQEVEKRAQLEDDQDQVSTDDHASSDQENVDKGSADEENGDKGSADEENGDKSSTDEENRDKGSIEESSWQSPVFAQWISKRIMLRKDKGVRSYWSGWLLPATQQVAWDSNSSLCLKVNPDLFISLAACETEGRVTDGTEGWMWQDYDRLHAQYQGKIYILGLVQRGGMLRLKLLDSTTDLVAGGDAEFILPQD